MSNHHNNQNHKGNQTFGHNQGGNPGHQRHGNPPWRNNQGQGNSGQNQVSRTPPWHNKSPVVAVGSGLLFLLMLLPNGK